MKSTDNFKKVIEAHIEKLASKDSNFAEKVKDPDKNIDDCITYILNQVKKSGCNGFEDAEIFGMALHYYDEKKVKPGDKINADVIVNHKVELSEKEIEEARQEAKDKLIAEEMSRIRNKPRKSSKESKTDVEPTLFDV